MAGQGELFEADPDSDYRAQVEPLIKRAMATGAERKAAWDRQRLAKFAAWDAGYKARGEFAVGDRVVMSGQALYSAGRNVLDAARVWSVVECRCDLCEPGRHVAVDQWIEDAGGWRHIAKAALRHYGQPCVDELKPEQTTADMASIAKGLSSVPLPANYQGGR